MRWCQASAIRAVDPILLACSRVYQNMASLETMETTAAASASTPGISTAPPPAIFRTASTPMPPPTSASTAARIMAATHSNRSWP